MIGKGTYGKVYLAFNATSGEIMAVKQVELPSTPADRMKRNLKEIVDALRSERETLRQLDHENIVQYLGFEENTETVNVCVHLCGPNCILMFMPI
jgi:serine/threonine protein kinase